MAVLRIERVPIKVANLGWFGLDHLHLVLETDLLGAEQDAWWVMEGVRDPSGDITRLGTIGGNGTTTLSQANDGKTGDALVAEIGLPEWRGSRVIPLGGQELLQWVEMAGHARDIDDQQFPYIGVATPLDALSTINSSSVVASLLYYIGVDITEYFPTTLRLSPGWETLLGTMGDDEIALQGGFRNAYGGRGDDILQGQGSNVIPEKLYGGRGDDTFLSSSGVNYFNGGEYGLAYREDGTDTVVYRDIDVVTINFLSASKEHYVADFEVIHSSGYDQLYSIERVEWDTNSTEVLTGPGVSIIKDSLRFDLGGQSSLDDGDHVNFANAGEALLINVDAEGVTVVQAEAATDSNVGIWIENVERLTGSAEDDHIYTAAGVLGVDAGAGNDLVDVRLATPFSAASPQGYDIEVSGGEGDDTIVSGPGRTYAAGGAGSDRFVLSAFTETEGSLVEFVIEDGALEDRVFVPIDVFKVDYGDYEGSLLFPLLGAIGQTAGEHSFEDLPQNLGPWLGGPDVRSDFFSFEWQLQDDRHYGSDQTQVSSSSRAPFSTIAMATICSSTFSWASPRWSRTSAVTASLGITPSMSSTSTRKPSSASSISRRATSAFNFMIAARRRRSRSRPTTDPTLCSIIRAGMLQSPR